MTWEEWLKTEESYYLITKCAKILLSSPKTLELMKQSFGQAEIEQDELSSILWEFCFDHAKAWEEKKPFENCRAYSEYPKNWILQQYKRALIDSLRNLNHSPQKYLYARIRTTLSATNGVAITVTKHGTFYCFDTEKEFDLSKCYCKHYEESYQSWPFPSYASLENIWKGDVIYKIARFFWDEICRRENGILWVPVQALQHYICSNLPVHNYTHISINQPSSHQENDEQARKIELACSDEDIHPLMLYLDEMEKLASKFAMRLTERERKILFLYYGASHSLAEIAKELGLGNVSSAAYHLNKIRKSIKELCILYPALSPPDLDENLFGEFMDKVIEICKSSIQSRKDS